jgi:ribosome-associated protein
LDGKAEEIVILDVSQSSSFTDYFLVCQGQSSRQVKGIARHIEEKASEAGFEPLGIEGYQEGSWVLMDYDDIVIHVFHRPIREFYDIERLWSDAPRTTIDEEDTSRVSLDQRGLV